MTSSPDMATPLPIRNRLLAVAALSAFGGITFLPFLSASNHQPAGTLLPFVVFTTAIAVLIAWPGLRCADKTGLPMPLLRWLDGESFQPIPLKTLFIVIGVGIALGLFGKLALRFAEVPSLPGSIFTRILSTFFAAGTLEIVLHLGVMSIAVLFFGGKRWPGILIAALFLVFFHLTGNAFQHASLTLVAIAVGNGTIGLVLGFVYSKFGFESVILCHGIAHLFTVLGSA